MQVRDRQSLEMDQSGLEAVKTHIEQNYSGMETRVAGIVTLVRFGGCEFIFENEWEEPFLLAKSAAGDDLLKAICNHFSG